MDAFSPFHDVEVEGCLSDKLGRPFFSRPLFPGDFLSGFFIDTLDQRQLFFGGHLPVPQQPGKPATVTGFTGLALSGQGIASEQPTTCFLMEDVATLAAQPLLQHHVGPWVDNSFASLARVKNLLGSMKASVTGSAVRDRLDVFDDFVLDFKMALIAFDFVPVDVDRVHQVGISVPVEAVWLEMALVAVFPRHSPIAYDDLAMALIASPLALVNSGMVKPGVLGRGQARLVMAVGAATDFRIMLARLEMAEETAALCDGNVLTLNDLRVAARAA